MYHVPAVVGTAAQLLALAILILNTNLRHESIDTNEELLTDSYDYIVVGSGSAGAIIAHRLADDYRTRVLLLEAGGPTGVANDIPAQATTSSHFSSRYDWNYTMEPQFVGRAFVNGVIPETRGFAIGGTSSINTMIFNRGNMRGYDSWAQEFGAIGWSYADVLPYFKRYENNRDPYIVSQNPDFHGTSGPLEITSWAKPDPLMLIHQEILNKEAGIPTTDINGPVQVGTTLAQACIDSRGVRSSASNAYIDPNPFPHNLHILSGALVTKVIIEHKRAVGVLFIRKGQGFRVMAKKEVIVSGGVYGSPKLLMLSGVGPKEHLEKLKIPVVEDLPVGDNLQNHPGNVFQFLIKPSSLKLTNFAGILSAQQMHEWFTTNSGPLATHHRAVTYFSTSSNQDKDWPNVGWETAVYQFPTNFTSFSQFQFADRHAWEAWFSNFLGRYYLFVHGIVQRTRSRGMVRLASNNPHDDPIIQTNFLQHPLDYQDEIEMTRSVIQFYERSSMSQHLEPLIPIPGCKLCPDKRYVYECESYIRCHVEQALYSSYHPVGTCRMGDLGRKDVVVDSYLRVKGISNLRVCDNSIIPLLQNSNTNAGALMIGEKCAQMIKDQSPF